MKLLYAESRSFDPYYNLAVEELMMREMQNKEDTTLLFLWQNGPSVIIGRNQDPYIECDVELLRKNGCLVVRRKSGGGAVYHDLGNLNYSFLAVEAAADKDKWNSIICDAVKMYGLNATLSGRNDITIDGKKFSGSAFNNDDGVVLQHGTLMVDVDIDAVRTYLKPARSKLQKHGIRSVDQRVQNLKSFNGAVSISGLKENIQKAALEAYSSERLTLVEPEDILDEAELKYKYDEYSSYEFIYDTSIEGSSSDEL